MDKSAYLDALSRDSAALLASAHQGLDASVGACPDWNTGQLLGHVLEVYLHWTARVRGGSVTKEALTPYPGLWDWSEVDLSRDSRPPNLLSYAEPIVADLQATLAAAHPSKPVKTWFPPDQTAGFVQRRMAQETAVHRWDMQAAHGAPDPIDPELARDGIDEMLDVHLPIRPQWVQPRSGSGETYHFHSTDVPGEWFVEFVPDGPRVSREHRKADVAVRGSASDLLLWLWGRVPVDRLDVVGDAALVDRWFELVPAD